MEDDTIILEFFKRPVAYNVTAAKAFKSVKLGILWSQLFYWNERTRDPEKWVYKTQSDLYDETGLSRKEQETARKKGIELGILETKLAGNPATVHFRIDVGMACNLMREFIAKQKDGQKIMFDSKKKIYSSLDYLRETPEEDIKAFAKSQKVNEEFVRARIVDVLDYCEAHGKRYKDYRAAIRNFIKTHRKEHPEDPAVKIYKDPKQVRTINAEISDEQRKKNIKEIEKSRKALGFQKSMKENVCH